MIPDPLAEIFGQKLIAAAAGHHNPALERGSEDMLLDQPSHRPD